MTCSPQIQAKWFLRECEREPSDLAAVHMRRGALSAPGSLGEACRAHVLSGDWLPKWLYWCHVVLCDLGRFSGVASGPLPRTPARWCGYHPGLSVLDQAVHDRRDGR
jgi:hypothetical protein